MKIKSASLEQVAALPQQYPKESLPEIAFVGRSNVGKSSLINSILQRKNLARTSAKPGKTRTVNFYRVNDTFRLVDLPGYGYAAVSKSEKEKWADIIDTYLTQRGELVMVVQLVDLRHKPSALDLQMLEWVRENGFEPYIVCTKADKIAKTKRRGEEQRIAKQLDINPNRVLSYSAQDGYQLDKITDLLEDLLGRIEVVEEENEEVDE